MKRTLIVIIFLFIITLPFTIKKLNAKKLITNTQEKQVIVTIPKSSKDILGVAFHLNYPKGQTYIGNVMGDFLTQNNQTPIVLIQDKPLEQKLIVGISLKRTDQLPTGGGEIIRFNFSKEFSSKKETYLSDIHVRSF